MGILYNYYYIGKQISLSNTIEKQDPIILNFSTVQNGKKGESPSHIHSYLEIFYFLYGEGFLKIKNKTYTIKANDYLIIDADTMHEQYSDNNNNEPLTFYCFAIDHIQLANYKANSISEEGYLFHSFVNDSNNYINLIKEISDELQKKETGYYMKIRSLFQLLFVDTIRLFSVKEKNIIKTEKHIEINKLVKDIKIYIENNYQSNIKLDNLVKLFYFNKSYLLHQFKIYCNISPIQYLIAVRMEEAKKLLLQTNLSISEIASRVGYDNPVYFSEIFNKAIGTTPTLYKKIREDKK